MTSDEATIMAFREQYFRSIEKEYHNAVAKEIPEPIYFPTLLDGKFVPTSFCYL